MTHFEKNKLVDLLNLPAVSFMSTVAEPDPSVARVKDSKLLSLLQTDSSAVVDENGEPMVVYHGSGDVFNTFDVSRGRRSMDVQGMYFSPLAIEARDYGSNVMPVFVSLKNPAIDPYFKGLGVTDECRCGCT